MTIPCLMGLGCSRADNKDSGHKRPEQKAPRTVLDPIAVKPARSRGDAHRQDEGDSPAAGRRALVQGSTIRRGSSKVHPVSSAEAGVGVNDEDADNASSASASTTPSRAASQRGTSNSTKNKAQHGFDSIQKQMDAQTRADSQRAQGSDAVGVGASVSEKRGKTESTACKSSNQTSSHKQAVDSLDINENKSTVHPDHSPNRGITSGENRRSDGRGYSDDGFSTYEAQSLQQTSVCAGDRQRSNKEDVSEDQVSLVRSAEKGDQRPVDLPKSAAPSGVTDMGIHGAAATATTELASSVIEDDHEDETVRLTKSSSFQHSVARRQQIRKDQEEQAKLEQENREDEEERRQQQKLKTPGSNESLLEDFSIAGSSMSSPSNLSSAKTTATRPAALAVTPRNTIRTRSSDPLSSQSTAAMARSPETDPPAEEWKPFSDPEAALRAAQKKLDSGDWEVKTEGLNMIRRIVNFHPETFSAPPVLHSVILLVVKEVKNLRSQVSRLAIVCLGDMFVGLKKAMDPDVDIVTQQLLAKCGESNNFIRDDVECSLSAMVEGVTPKLALLALIVGGATHKNTVVRRTTAQFLAGVVERMGSGKVLSGAKDITDRVLPTAAQFVMDGSPETRYYGRKILYLLMSHQHFDRMLTKYLPANTLRNIQDVVENLKNKGLGEKPSETASARSRLSGQASRMGSSLRGGSASSSLDGLSNTPPTVRKPARTDEATLNEIKTMISRLSSSEWRVRYDAISAFQEMCVERPDAVSLHIVKILDQFLPRLQDPNSKVNLHALKVMLQVVSTLKEALQSVISIAVTAVVPNLSSKNRQIKDTANLVLDSYMEHLDHTVLIQPFSSQAQCATGQSKAEMVIKVAYLTDRVYERKPKQIMMHVLPLLWHLLGAPGVGVGSGAGELRSATAALASTLHSHMGQGLLDKAGSEPSVTARHMNILQEIL